MCVECGSKIYEKFCVCGCDEWVMSCNCGSCVWEDGGCEVCDVKEMMNENGDVKMMCVDCEDVEGWESVSSVEGRVWGWYE